MLAFLGIVKLERVIAAGCQEKFARIIEVERSGDGLGFAEFEKLREVTMLELDGSIRVIQKKNGTNDGREPGPLTWWAGGCNHKSRMRVIITLLARRLPTKSGTVWLVGAGTDGSSIPKVLTTTKSSFYKLAPKSHESPSDTRIHPNHCEIRYVSPEPVGQH